MGIFHDNLSDQIDSLIRDLKKRSLAMPDNWHWLDYKKDAKAVVVEEIDIRIVQKLNELHERGKDIPALTSRILTLCSELLGHLEAIRKSRGVDELSSEGRTIQSIADEIGRIYSRELSMMKSESGKLMYDNKVVQECKRAIVNALNRKDVNWDAVQKSVRDVFCTRSVWHDFIGGEKDLLVLIKKDGKYYEYYKVYKDTLAKIEAAALGEMKTTKEGSSWFHIETSPEMPSKLSFLGFSFKRYATLDPSSMWDMLKYLLKLAAELRRVGLAHRDRVNVKIPASFLSFMNHPDSIVIHYHNPGIRREIEDVLQRWLAAYHIKAIAREYGRAEHARDFVGTSFSDNVALTVVNLMKSNLGKMSNEALAISGINYGFRMSEGNS